MGEAKNSFICLIKFNFPITNSLVFSNFYQTDYIIDSIAIKPSRRSLPSGRFYHRHVTRGLLRHSVYTPRFTARSLVDFSLPLKMVIESGVANNISPRAPATPTPRSRTRYSTSRTGRPATTPIAPPVPPAPTRIGADLSGERTNSPPDPSPFKARGFTWTSSRIRVEDSSKLPKFCPTDPSRVWR